ncbi:hypothetical protein DVH24_001328, partial [Malus domestica]
VGWKFALALESCTCTTWITFVRSPICLPCRVRLTELASTSTCWQTHDVYRHEFDGGVEIGISIGICIDIGIGIGIGIGIDISTGIWSLASASTCWQTHEVYRHEFDGGVGKLFIILLLFMVFLWAKDIRVSCPLELSFRFLTY